MFHRRMSKWMLSASVMLLTVAPAFSAKADVAFGITNNQVLVSWDTSSPGTLTSGFFLTGLQMNEQIVGIDFRPLDGQLFAVGSTNRLYTVNTSTGALTQVGPVFPLPLDGSQFGYDFNPTIDRSRIDTDTNNNYVINPNGGGQTQVTDVFYPGGDPNFGVDPNVVHLGYTNSVAGALATQLFGIDSGLDILVTQANSLGTLGTVGTLGINITGVGGFDISGTSGIAYGAFQLAGSSQSQFYTVNLSTGAVTLIGQIGGGTVITALAVQNNNAAIPEPTTLVVTGLGMLGLCVRRRRR